MDEVKNATRFWKLTSFDEQACPQTRILGRYQKMEREEAAIETAAGAVEAVVVDTVTEETVALVAHEAEEAAEAMVVAVVAVDRQLR